MLQHGEPRSVTGVPLSDVYSTLRNNSHSYTVWGVPIERSVTMLVGALFEAFDPEQCTLQHFARWARDPQSKYYEAIQQVHKRGGTDEEAAAVIRQGWAALGEEASRLGTALHLHAELDANRVAAEAPRELLKEVQQFEAFLRSGFVRDAGLRPYRTELSVAWRVDGHAVTAGQIDCLYQSREGLVIMVDFKRVASKHSLEPWASSYGKYGKPPLEELPDAPFWRYSLQQSLYNVMAKQVGARVRRQPCAAA